MQQVDQECGKQDRKKKDRPLAANGAAPSEKTKTPTFATLDLLWGIAKDATATPAERRKAASQVAECFLDWS